MVDCRHNFVSRGMRSYFLWILAGLYFLNALLYFRYFNATEPTSCAVDGSVSLVHWSATKGTNSAKHIPDNTKYLIPLEIWNREQLTQFKVVIRDFMKLARLSGRTLVLPYVAKSHIWNPSARGSAALGTRTLYPFTYYFDLIGIDEYVPNGVIEMDEYLARTGVNRKIVAFNTICYGNNCDKEFEVIDCKSPSALHAMNQAPAQVAGYFTVSEYVCFKVKDKDHKGAVDLLTGKYADADVGWTYFHKAMVNSADIPQLLEISSYVKSEAQKFQQTSLGGKYVSLHWRFEKSRLKNIPAMVTAVQALVDANMHTVGTNKIFFATEYASGASDSWSTTGRTEKRPFYEQLVQGFTDRGYEVYQGYTGEVVDEGAVAMIDSWLCENSDVFVPVDYSSSFTRAMVEARDKRGAKTDKSIYANYEWDINPDTKNRLDAAVAQNAKPKSVIVPPKKKAAPIGKLDIMFVVVTTKSRHTDHVQNQLASWVKGIEDHVFFLSDTKDSGLIGQEYEKANFIDTECGAGEDDISRLCKNEFIVKLFLENYQERGYKWLFRVEDDSYIFVETLVEYLQTLDSTKPLAIGEKFCHPRGIPFLSGKPGFVLSQAVFETFKIHTMKRIPAEINTMTDDIVWAVYMHEEKIPLVNHNGFSYITADDNHLLYKDFSTLSGNWNLPFKPIAYYQFYDADGMPLLHERLHKLDFKPAPTLRTINECKCMGATHTRCLPNPKKANDSDCSGGIRKLECLLE